MKTTDEIQTTLKNLPKKPGVYRYYNMDGSLLYVGKAKNLKNRVSSYFQESRPHNQRISLMVSQIKRIEYTVVSSEEESLLLEANLINSLQPKYNIKLKDDKSYCYIRLDAGQISGFSVVRQKFDIQSIYFGPYSSRFAVEETLRTLRSIFPYCEAKKPQDRPCAYAGIGQCDGICTGKEDPQVYSEKIAQIKKVLSGKIGEVESYLLEKIKTAVKQDNFALATLWKERLNLLKRTVQSKKVILPSPQDVDLVSLIIDCDKAGLQLGSVFVQQIREGRVINVSNFLLSGSELDEVIDLKSSNDDDLAQKFFTRFLTGYYAYQSDRAPVLIQSFSHAADKVA